MSQSNAYKKVEKPRASNQDKEIQKNEIRITAQGRSRSYISYAVGLLDPTLLQKDESLEVMNKIERGVEQFDTVVLKAMGKAIQKAVTIAEVLKRRVAGLHQITSIESQEIEDQYEPKEEGMDIVIKKRTVSSIIIKLSKKQLDTNDLGYQVPIPLDQVTAPQIITSSMQKRGVVANTANTSTGVATSGVATGGATASTGESGGVAAGKRRRRRVRGGASSARGRVATTTNATTNATTTTTTEKPTTTTTTQGERPPKAPRVPREPREPREQKEPREPREPRVPKHNNNATEGNVATTSSSTDAPTTAGRGRGRGRGTRGGRGRGVATGSSRGTGTSRGRGRGQARNGGGVEQSTTTSAATTQQE